MVQKKKMLGKGVEIDFGLICNLTVKINRTTLNRPLKLQCFD